MQMVLVYLSSIMFSQSKSNKLSKQVTLGLPVIVNLQKKAGINGD